MVDHGACTIGFDQVLFVCITKLNAIDWAKITIAFTIAGTGPILTISPKLNRPRLIMFVSLSMFALV